MNGTGSFVTWACCTGVKKDKFSRYNTHIHTSVVLARGHTTASLGDTCNTHMVGIIVVARRRAVTMESSGTDMQTRDIEARETDDTKTRRGEKCDRM